MESGFFFSTLALAVELLVALLVIAYISVRRMQAKTSNPRLLWPAVTLASLAGVAAFAPSAHYLFDGSPDGGWLAFLAISLLLPLVLAAIVHWALRRHSEQEHLPKG